MGNFYKVLLQKKKELEEKESEELRKQLSRKPKKANLKPKREKISLHLGIDFGTSFTKVCYRDLNSEESVFIHFDEWENGFIPSLVYYTPSDDKIHFHKPSSNEVIEVPYLKMMLAGMEKPPKKMTFDHVIACSVRFLAEVIRMSKKNALKQSPDRFRNLSESWTGISLGVPVQYLETETEDLFRKILFVADLMADTGKKLPSEINDILDLYQKYKDEAEKVRNKLYVYPEIIAAVYSFILSREARSGCYTYFDVGGGTLDGILFGYRNLNGSRLVEVFEGRVKPLGVEKISYRLLREANDLSNFRKIRAALYEEGKYDLEVKIPMYNNIIMNDIQTHVAEVIFPMKKKVSPVLIQDSDRLPLFIGGGGAASPWFQNTIEQTYESRNHMSCGLPPYEKRGMDFPVDFILDKTAKCWDFCRYAIAYGLSFPPDEELKIEGLPKDARDIETAEQTESLNEKCDSIAFDLYGEHM